MSRGTGPAVALVIGAVKILDLWVSLIEMEMKVAAAVGTDQESGEHIVFTLIGAAFADFAPFLLHLFKDSTFNDRLMDVLEDYPIFTVILQTLLVLVRLGVGLEIEDITAILLQGQDFGDGGTVPFGRRLFLAFSGPLDSLGKPVGAGRQDTILFKLGGDLLCSEASRVMPKIRRTTWAASSSTIQRLGLPGSLM